MEIGDKVNYQVPLEDMVQYIYFMVDEEGSMGRAKEEDENEEEEQEEKPKEKPVLFKVNKPFVFIIYDERNELILYLTVINDPEDFVIKEEEY